MHVHSTRTWRTPATREAPRRVAAAVSDDTQIAVRGFVNERHRSYKPSQGRIPRLRGDNLLRSGFRTA